jgi:hypothetical protein
MKLICIIYMPVIALVIVENLIMDMEDHSRKNRLRAGVFSRPLDYIDYASTYGYAFIRHFLSHLAGSTERGEKHRF